MANIIQHKGAAYSRESGALFIDMKAAVNNGSAQRMQSTVPIEMHQHLPWSPWGKDNLFPQHMVSDIETTGILNSIIDGKARFAICEGMVPAIVKRSDKGAREIETFVDDPEINDFLEANNHFHQTYGWMLDQIGLANGVGRFMLNGERNKIVLFRRDDVSEMRYERMNKMGEIKNIYLSAAWDQVRSAKDERVITAPLLSEHNPLFDLEQKAANGMAHHAITFRYPSWGKKYYSTPLWYAAAKWVKIAQGVPEMKAALYSNSMRLKYMVVIYDSYWGRVFGDGQWEQFTPDRQEEERNKLFDQIDSFLVGSKNAHKSLYVGGSVNPIDGKPFQDIEIKFIEDNTPSGEYLPDSAAANSEIAFSLLFNPAIIGASMPSGPYTNSQGGSSVRESVLLQVVLHELERRNISRIMNVIKHFNGWAKRFPGLEFVIPATALTTLDTGAGTKPVVMGAKPKEEKEATDGNN